MKTSILYRFALIAGFTGMILTGCKKSNDNSAGQSNTDLQTQSDDQTRVSNETDALSDDVNASLTASGTIAGSSISPGIRYGVTTDGGGPDTLKNTQICDAVVVADTVSNPHTLTITYNGANCAGNRT